MAQHEAPPAANPPQFYPVQFHPEFGYLVPAIRLRRSLALTCKTAALGALIGAAAVVALSPDREERVLTVLSMQTEAAAGEVVATEPVRFVEPTLALPVAARRVSPPLADPSLATVDASAAPDVSAQVKPAPQQRKTIARPLRRSRNARVIEPDPRSAYAGPYRREEQRRDVSGRGGFGFGW